ncbi:MAG: histidinol dehydrogenase [Ginsengibacter sp.]
MNTIFKEPLLADWKEIITRPVMDLKSLEEIVLPVLNEIKTDGDTAVKKYALQFEGVLPTDLKIRESEIANAGSQLSEELKNAILLAKENITKFHSAQVQSIQKIETTNGVTCWRKAVAIDNVGLYIPGGSAPLFSTLLMLAIPAQIAGCKNIFVCTPVDKTGKVHPAVLYTASLLGLKNIFAVGGIQAIAAMAYGTETIGKVNKIFGPGNQYVTCAKQLINREGIAIDMPAGPSEVLVYADETAVPAFVAADLLSQAEHGADSQVILVATSENIIEEVKSNIESQLANLPRKEIAEKALTHSRMVVFENPDTAFDFINEYAAEHLIIASENAVELADKVRNAGSVFLGNYSPESVGDYASGTNHTLPTNGYAKAYSGVSVDSFIKQITFQQLSQQGIHNIGPAVETMAAAEGLEGHKNAVTVRLNYNPAKTSENES